MITSERLPEGIVCNTTPVRYFSFVEQVNLLSRILAGRIRLPREVFDPADDLDGPDALLSEIGKSIVYWRRRGNRGSGFRNYSRLIELRLRTDIEIIDLSPRETTVKAELTAKRAVATYGLRGRLGSGEAAVMAVAESRQWAAVIDDSDARKVLARRCPECVVWTTQELLKRAVAAELVTTPEASSIYDAMLNEGYIGPHDLWA